jgi:uncharacterized protein DUF4238
MAKSHKAAGKKHHYIPKFYLKQWAGGDGRLCEFSRPFKRVVPRRTHPDGTGYQRGLYTFNELPPVLADFIESQFLQLADDRACATLKELLIDNVDVGADAKSAWSRFLMTLMHRNPERIAHLRASVTANLPTELERFRPTYEARGFSNFLSFKEFCMSLTSSDLQGIALHAIRRLMDSELLGTTLNRMIWGVMTNETARHNLLTSDRPVTMSNGLARPDGHVLLPISPTRLFIAVNNIETARHFEQMKRGKLLEHVNHRVASQAYNYVYGDDDRQLRFVENRLGKRLPWGPLG